MRPEAFYTEFGWDCLDRTLAVTRTQVDVMLEPRDVIVCLRKAKIPFMAMGLYGIAGWLKEPRTTEDFDVLVAMKDVKKATKAVVLQRVEEVLAIRLDGAQLHDIRRYASENGWGVSDRQLERYIEKADTLLVERRQRKWGRMRALHLARREALDARALQAADYRTALAVSQDMAKLQELHMDERELRKVQRELKELEARMKPLLRD